MDVGEFEFIESIKRDYGTSGSSALFGIGDDCAVIPYTDEKVYIVSKDLLIEGVHFELGNIGLEDLGWKALAVNLSDIAAMGGEPNYVFIGIAVPPSFTSLDLSLFYEGIKSAAEAYGLFLLGGDTTASTKHFMVSITIMGTCLKDKILYRHGAELGDNIYITGTLGDSGAGFLLSRRKNIPITDNIADYLRDRHKRPSPRVREMLYLNSRYNLSNAIDISDGLSSDLGHILDASGCGALLDLSLLPISSELLSLSEYLDIQELILSFGEDYEVLFTTAEIISPKEIEEFRQNFGILLTKIGNITKSGLYIKDKDITRPLRAKGYQHFR